jgi:hypothetical protein
VRTTLEGLAIAASLAGGLLIVGLVGDARPGHASEPDAGPGKTSEVPFPTLENSGQADTSAEQPEGDGDKSSEENQTDAQAGLMPDNHQVAWIQRHGSIARSQGATCSECHTERDCASCHDEKVAAPFSVHPPNFDTLHAVDARSRGSSCAECHSLTNFCTDCHIRSEITMRPEASPPPRQGVHPEGWTDPDTPNNHGVEARQRITECVSCHTEDDCVSCHTGIDPHPPEFTLNCGRWLRADPRPCAKCHGDLSRLERLCQ